ncbi:MAG: FtsQ-type POTRA domain-containing protein, partial [bacterium]|nr:FtsQ-type POTRA domain-containing protein [bacterium]
MNSPLPLWAGLRSAGARYLSWGLVLCALMLVPSGLLEAQELNTLRLEEGQFLIESISVDGLRTLTREIVVSESRLVPGRKYVESDLRDASHRIRRLPLVLDVEFSLRRGSERGRFELVILVRESRLWFWGLDVSAARWDEPVVVQGFDQTSTIVASNALIGRRFRAGRHGLVHAALGGPDGMVNAGYTHYDLLNRGGVLNLTYGFSSCGGSEDVSAS